LYKGPRRKANEVKKNEWKAAPWALAFLLFSITSSFSQPPGMGMRFGKGDPNCRAASELNLSQDQAKGFDGLQQAFIREVQLLRIQLFSKRLELRELLTNPGTKIEAIRAKAAEIQEIQARLEEKSIDYLIRIRALLTQEQLKSWCPESDLPGFRRMMHGHDAPGPFPPRRPPFPEGAKPE
jgi:Spy/CpxP family protein refolding chaperone